jgi:predicted MFS family arabinose efflux permease
MRRLSRRQATVTALGLAQTLAWASSYYLPAMLAAPMARDLGVDTASVFADFSAALIVSALVGPVVGQAIDRRGGRPVLMATSMVFALGLTLLATAQGPATLLLAWLVLGLGMGSGLYEAAFAALVRLDGPGARDAITGITLFAGFASTVGWPLSTVLEAQFGWRGACATWALLHVAVGLPLNACLPLAPPHAPADAGAHSGAAGQGPGPPAPSSRPVTSNDLEARHPGESAAAAVVRMRVTAILFAYVFAAAWFVSTAMASHLPRLLQACGATRTAAVAAGALIGPAQVAGRLLEFGVLRRVHPLLSARLAAMGQPLGAAVLLFGGAPLAALFALLHGAGNGILTIAKGTLPLALFGPQAYGARQGWLMLPARVTQALAPWMFGLVLDRWGQNALWLSGGLGLSAFVALMVLPTSVESKMRR